MTWATVVKAKGPLGCRCVSTLPPALAALCVNRAPYNAPTSGGHSHCSTVCMYNPCSAQCAGSGAAPCCRLLQYHGLCHIGPCHVAPWGRCRKPKSEGKPREPICCCNWSNRGSSRVTPHRLHKTQRLPVGQSCLIIFHRISSLGNSLEKPSCT